MLNHPALRRRLVPAATLNSVEQSVSLAGAMMAGGLDVIEITLRTPVALEAIERVASAFPSMAVGAGTVLSIEQLDDAIAAGASYAVSPGLNPEVIAHAQSRDFLLMPGVITATEIDHAIRLGCRLLKFFPAAASGGIARLSAVAAPYAHTGVMFMPTGGVNASNAADYLGLDVVVAVGGSWMVNATLVAEKKWDAITRLCREAVALAARC